MRSRSGQPGSALMAAAVLLTGAMAAATPGTLVAAPAPSGPTVAAASISPAPAVMRQSRLSAGQLAAWYRSATPVAPRVSVTVDELAHLFVQEGRDEGVAGDLAFVQGVLETGWYGFSGRVPPSANNFGGIGATDSTSDYNVFPTARIGVRAQIQHLRAYADPTVTEASLAHPLESPRFHLVDPKGKAPTWAHMGDGNWATDPYYSEKILRLYADLLAHAETPSFPDVPADAFYRRAVAWMERSGVTSGVGRSGLFMPGTPITRGEVATMLWRAGGQQAGPRWHGFVDVVPGSYYERAVAHLRAAGITTGAGAPDVFDPDGAVTRAQVVTFLWRSAGRPEAPRHGFPDVAPDTYYDRAVSWASRHGITNGVGTTGRFQASDPVTRGEVAAFLHRAVSRQAAWVTPLPPTAP